MGAVPALAIAPEPIPDGYVDVAEAARMLRMTVRAVQKRCNDTWRQFAIKTDDGRWFLDCRADKALVNLGRVRMRDTRRLAELRSDGVRPEFLAVAECRRDIVLRWNDADSAGSAKTQFERFKAALLADGVVPCEEVKKPPSMATVYQWRKDYHDKGIAALVPQFDVRGPVRREVGAKAWKYYRTLLHCGNDFRHADAYRLTKGMIARRGKTNDPDYYLPSRAILRARAAEMDPGLATLCNKGQRAYDAAFIPKARRDVESLASCDEWDGDERTLDVMIRVRTARGWKPTRNVKLTAWRDMRSGMITGWTVALHADSNTILGSLKMGIRDVGKPLRLRTDWGRDYQKAVGHVHTKRWKLDEFDGARIGNVLEQLGIECRPVEPYHPQSKPIESLFARLKSDIDKAFASFTGGSPAERREDFSDWVRGNLHLLPTLDELIAVVGAGIEAYNNTPQNTPAMFGYTPVYAMEVFRDGPARTETQEALDFLFCDFVGPKVVRRDGIRWRNQYYGFGDDRLIKMQGRKVWLAVQPDDVRTVMVCDEQRQALFRVDCGNEVIRTQRDLEEHCKRRSRLRRAARAYQREAREQFLGIRPEDHIANRLAGVRAMNGEPAEPKGTPRLTVARPGIEAALAKAGPAPSDSASNRVRSDSETDFNLLDLLDDGEPEAVDRGRESLVAGDDVDGDITWDDLSGDVE